MAAARAATGVLSHVGLPSDSDGDCVSGGDRSERVRVPVVVGLGDARRRRVHLSKKGGDTRRENHRRRAKDVHARLPREMPVEERQCRK